MDAKYWSSRGGNEIAHLLTKMDILLLLRRQMDKFRIKTVLDIGCGAGVNFPIYADLGYTALGLDFSKRRVDIANDIARTLGYEQINAKMRDVVKQPFPATPYDAVVISELLHHLPEEDVATVIKKARGLSGLFFVIGYYDDPYDEFAEAHGRRCAAAGLAFNEIVPEKGFTSAAYDYPALFGMPYEFYPLHRWGASLLVFEKEQA